MAIHHPEILHRWQKEAHRVFSQLPKKKAKRRKK